MWSLANLRYENYNGKLLILIVFTLVLTGVLIQNAHADKVIATIPLSPFDSLAAVGVAVNPITNRIYIGGEIPGMTVIDGKTNQIIDTLPVFPLGGWGGMGTGIDVDSHTNKIYYGDTVIDGSTGQQNHFGGSSMLLTDVRINPITNKVYMSGSLVYCKCPTNSIDVWNATDGQHIKTIYGYGWLNDIAINKATNRIYVGSYDNGISVLDGTTDNVIGSIEVSSTSLAINQVTNRLYAVTEFGGLYVIDLGTNSVITALPMVAYSVAVNPNTNKIYVGNVDGLYTGHTVTVVDGYTNTVEQKIQVGKAPTALAINPNTNRIYVLNQSGSLSVIQGCTPAQDTQNLLDTLNHMNLPEEITQSLDSTLDSSINSLNSSYNNSAKNDLQAFISEVNAQAGKKIPQNEASQLISTAQTIINSIP